MSMKNVISWSFILLFTIIPLAGCNVNTSILFVDTNETEYYSWNATKDENQTEILDFDISSTENYDWNITNAEIQMNQTFDYAATSVSLKTPVVYVDTDGTGNYNCDGSNDHVQINQALSYINGRGGGTVYLRGPNTYWIDSTLNIGANTILTGDSTAEIKLVANAGWSSDVPLIRGATGADNIVITGFTIDGNSESQSGIPKGQGYYNLILFQSSNNVQVSDMRLEWGTGDGMKVYSGNGIKFLYNDVYKLGHDACYILYSNNGECAYNTVMTRTNSACRITWGSHFTIHDNIFYSDLSGGDSTGPAIEIDKTNTGSTAVFDDIEIYNNKIYSINGAGIWMFAGYPDNVIRAKNVHIHHNTFTKVGQYATNTGYSNAAIVIQNFDNTIIENNVFDDGGHAAIKWYVWAGHIAQQNAQFTTYVRNNIIMNSDGVSGVTGSGVGIWNTQPSYAKFIVQNNNIYNNKNGQTYGSGFTMSNNLNVDPLCADSTNSKLISRDYHLKSKAGRYSSGKWVTDSVSSSLIDSGNSKCICSNEPSPNGAIINIGRYGNTNEASKSGSSASTVPNQIDDSLTAYDNRLREASPTTVTSDSNFVDIGQSGTRYRDVMWFDLSEYSTSDTVSKATLSLYWYYPTTTRTSDTVVEIYRPLEWDPKYVTWNNRASGTPWTTAGGNWYDKNGVAQGSTPYATITFPASTMPGNKYYEFDVTQLVQEYVSGKNKNTGFFLKAKTESNNYIAFYSSEWTNAAQRPKLTVTVTEVSDNAPVANAGADKTAATGSTVSFDGSASTDDKGIASYSWDFDASNGITSEATGKTATKTYTTTGTYTVTLTVTDTSGQKATDTVNVVVSTTPVTNIEFDLAAYDNRLREAAPTTIYADSNYIDIGQSGTRYRNVMWFDLSEYSSTDTVSKATLSLYWYYPTATRTSDTVIEIYRPLEWDPKYVTWNNRASGTPWNTAGGNWYDKNGVAQGSTPYATLTFPAGTVAGNKYYEFDVTQLVQEYISGKNKNTGFFLKAKTESNNYIAFYSSEWTNAAQRPKLTVTTTAGSTIVDNVPVANAGVDKTANTGSAVSFDGSASTDDKGIASYSWDFDASNGITSEATGKTATKTYTTTGTYTVTLTVTDTSGQKATDTVNVVVSTTPVTNIEFDLAAYDNRLREAAPTTVTSDSNFIDIGQSGTRYRDVMWFDLSEYSTSDTVSKATLSLYWYYPTTTRTSDTVVEIYRPLEWDPKYVTWNNRASGTPWTTAGGNWYDKNGVAQGSTPYATITFPASTMPGNKYYEFDVTQLVQEYVSGKNKNTGFFLKAKTESNNYIAFYSSEWTNAAQRPKLTVTTGTSSTPADNVPVANAGADKAATTGSAVSFDGGASSDDKGIVSYRWDFDASNGISIEATGKTATKTYTTAGTYTVTLTVIDASGQQSSDTLKVVVSSPVDKPPVANAGADKTATKGTAVSFTGSLSTDDKGIVSYRWDFDASNGITNEATGMKATKTYTTAGTYTVTLTVIDASGQKSTDTLKVVVK